MNQLHRWLCRSKAWKREVEERIVPWALEGVNLGDQVLEIGPGPGLTTEVLRHCARHLTAIEIDPQLADSLRRRLQSDNLVVIKGDATQMPFPENSFSSAVCFTMLHHIPSAALQDRLLSEVYRSLKSGAIFAGSDSMTSLRFRLLHIRDTMVVVDPNTFGGRLERAGFCDVHVEVGKGAFRFRAHKRPS